MGLRTSRFDLSESLKQAHRTKLLARKRVYATPSVVPSPADLSQMVKAAGGEFVAQRPSRNMANLIIIGDLKDTAEV